MNKEIQAIAEDLPQAKVALRQIYKVLYNVRHINKQEESSYYNAVINNDTIDINSSLKENSKNSDVKVISEKEFNYKMVYYYTFFMLMDRFKSIGCWIGAETPA